jgi:hypothetical protein
MNTIDSLVIIAIVALIHASFQLSISMLTLLSSHAIGAKRSHARLLSLTTAFTAGVFTMTVLLISTAALFAQILTRDVSETPVWIALCGLLFGLGIAVWIFYYRREQGTALWVPRQFARYLSDRTKATKQTGEAFGLGISSVFAELLFIFAPILVGAFVLITLEPVYQAVGIGIYTLLSLLPLLVIGGMIGSGHKLSKIQRWREQNKSFVQFIAGGGLVVLGFYLYVDRVLSPAVMAAAGSV